MTRKELITMLILGVVSDDYEETDKVMRDVTSLGDQCNTHISPAELLENLRDLVEGGLVSVYRLYTDGRPATKMPTMPDADEIENYYFWATESGRDFRLATYSNWPFDDEGSLKCGWAPPQT